jgi:hypothetical protein
MKPQLAAVALVFGLVSSIRAEPSTSATAPAKSGCVTCHAGIEPIRDYESQMMKRIFAVADADDTEGCAVCHGGNPAAMAKADAHKGKAFYPDPGSPWVNDQVCGTCHDDHVSAQWNSLMMTQAGVIHGAAWSFGRPTGYEHMWGNYDTRNPKKNTARQGTDTYRAYMEDLAAREPTGYPVALAAVPAPPTDPARLVAHPSLAVFTYIRTECLRCHLAVRGRAERGEYRGMGCSACHVPYGAEGLYEGNDKSIPRDKPGHVLVHSIQATRKSKVTVVGNTYSGIPLQTCTVCHHRSKRIGASYQGLMESNAGTPYARSGREQNPLHRRQYIAMHQDQHLKEGMLCQDCHTSNCVHGDGFLAGHDQAQVQIECADCHGTTQAYPWELPLGYMDEHGDTPKAGPGRGLGKEVAGRIKQGTAYPPADGYLLSARGDILPEVVREGTLVVVHSAGGKDLKLKPLKMVQEEKRLNTAARVAMRAVGLHMDKMECYSCHAIWAPQVYGEHLRIDYAGGRESLDWGAAGQMHAKAEHASDTTEAPYKTFLPGKVEARCSYARWEEPALAVNGEGRQSPVMPLYQTSATIVGRDGRIIVLNHIFRTAPGLEGSGPQGQLAINTQPMNPHTSAHVARTCESCHLSEKTLGYGLEGGRLTRPHGNLANADLASPDGQVLPKQARPQIEPIAGLAADWSRFVTEDGNQVMTVGHNSARSRPLNNQERANTDRQHLCLACHQEIPAESLAVSVLHHVAKYADLLPKNRQDHNSLAHKNILIAAWAQVAPMLAGPPIGLAIAVCLVIWYRRVRRRPKSQQTV